MKQVRIGCVMFSLWLLAWPAVAAPSHCLTRYGACKYSASFQQFDYVNLRAPRGGEVKMAEPGTFDSLNPFLLKGVKAPAINGLFDTLMTAAGDEPESYYPLIAERAEVAADGRSATFWLNPAARWHDGTPITPADVLYSLPTLKEQADPSWRITYAEIERVEQTGPRAVRFHFATANRELPLLAASMPILPKHYYATHDFTKTTLESPLGSGPYKVEAVEPSRSITYARVKDYWAENLPSMRGQNNFDRIRYDMFRDENVALEAFKAGAVDFRQEYIARNWATAYDVPALREGRFTKEDIAHEIPQGMQAFVFNLRQSKFADRRVREAIGLTLDFNWQNKTLFYSAYTRNRSFFEHTAFQAKGVPEGAERALLERFKNALPAELFSRPFVVPETDGSGDNRAALVRAQELLKQAGWIIRDGKRVNAETGEVLSVEFMLRQPTMERVIAPMRRGLAKLGIASSIRHVDDAQYQKRVDDRDFDLVSIWINRGLFYPGSEQMSLWHSSQADVAGSNNLAGLKHPAVDAALAELTSSKDIRALEAAGRALDRTLLWEHVVIPHWHSNSFRVAYWNHVHRPATTPKYALGFQTWWKEP